jgi:glucose-6-phosphate 1-dehydrogenase
MPALYHRDRDGQLSADSIIIAVGRSALTLDAYRDMVRAGLQSNLAPEPLDEALWHTFSARLDYVELDAFDPSSWAQLRASLGAKGLRPQTTPLHREQALTLVQRRSALFIWRPRRICSGISLLDSKSTI